MTGSIARFFDETAEHYDVLEPWYEHLQARLAHIVGLGPAQNVAPLDAAIRLRRRVLAVRRPRLRDGAAQ